MSTGELLPAVFGVAAVGSLLGVAAPAAIAQQLIQRKMKRKMQTARAEALERMQQKKPGEGKLASSIKSKRR
jgi:hypothetical protein